MSEPQWKSDLRRSDVYILALTEGWPDDHGLQTLELAIELRMSIVLWQMEPGLSVPPLYAAYEGAKIEFGPEATADEVFRMVKAWADERGGLGGLMGMDWTTGESDTPEGLL